MVDFTTFTFVAQIFTVGTCTSTKSFAKKIVLSSIYYTYLNAHILCIIKKVIKIVISMTFPIVCKSMCIVLSIKYKLYIYTHILLNLNINERESMCVHGVVVFSGSEKPVGRVETAPIFCLF